MINWVDEQCRDWGSHWRWLKFGSHGWPPRSVLGKLIDEGAGAGQGTFRPVPPIKDSPPAYTAVNHALLKMAATHEMGAEVTVIHIHYLFGGKARGKAADLGISVEKYWQLVQSGHAFIAACMPDEQARGAVAA
jgi:hypothetical protein